MSGPCCRAGAEAADIDDRARPDLLTAIVAVVVAGFGVSLVIGLMTPILISRAFGNQTDFLFEDYLVVAAISGFVGAAFVRAIVRFGGYRVSYARALGALLAGSAVDVLILAASGTTSDLGAISGWFNPLAWVGFALSVYLLMKAPTPRDPGVLQREYKIPPGGAAWAPELEQQERRRGRT